MNAFVESIIGWRFQDPGMLALLLLIPLWLWWRRGHAEVSLLHASLRWFDDVETRSWRTRLLGTPHWLYVVGMAAVVVALARPVQRDPLPLESRGIDIVLCVDRSSSMLGHDMDPDKTRLEIAQDAALQFVENREHDRFGLVSFARFPDLECPPTLDHPALMALLYDVEPVENDSPEDATGIGTAVARAAQVLQKSEADAKVIVLFTDGEENVATSQTPEEIAPLHAAQLCREFGIRVYAIAAGIGYEDPEKGWMPIDTSQIKQVAVETDGAFFEARDATAVETVYVTIDNLERVTFEEPRFRVEDKFLSVLIFALSLMVLGRFLEATFFEVLP